MRIPSFAVDNQRSIALARCDQVPPLMVIAGPNGSGKSTLLNSLRSVSGDGPILYVGPHRTWRKQQVRQRHLFAGSISLEALLARNDTPGYEGINLFGGLRDPWSYDDTPNYLKHGLSQIEIQRREAIATRVDTVGRAEKAALPDPWQPLREVTTHLLPHMEFACVDTGNPEAVRVLWRVHGRDTLVDLDDLSSGEKSIIQIFYPLVEHTVKQLLAEVREPTAPTVRPDVCVLIDEPELHLHPNLQMKVFDYLRVLSSRDHIQVIVATHSPTIVEATSFEELFLLRPFELVLPGENQLVQVANDEERLAFLRNVFGATANLTALQPIVLVEGSRDDSSRSVNDRKLYRALHPRFDQVTLLAGGGKHEVSQLREAMEGVLPGLSQKLKVIALLDRDTESVPEIAGAVLLPVSMIENFLLDPDAIWEATQAVAERAHFETVEAVQSALSAILDSQEESEIERRALARLGDVRFRPKRPLADLSSQLEAFLSETSATYSPAAANAALREAESAVASLRASNRRREMFNGKEVIDELFRRHLHSTGLAKSIFKFEAARYARRRRAVTEFFDTFFTALVGSEAGGGESQR